MVVLVAQARRIMWPLKLLWLAEPLAPARHRVAQVVRPYDLLAATPVDLVVVAAAHQARVAWAGKPLSSAVTRVLVMPRAAAAQLAHMDKGAMVARPARLALLHRLLTSITVVVVVVADRMLLAAPGRRVLFL